MAASAVLRPLSSVAPRLSLRASAASVQAPAVRPSAKGVRTKLRYVRPSEEPLWVKLVEKTSNTSDVDVFVDVGDARPLIGQLSIDVQGFEVHLAPSAVESWDNVEAVKAVYYPEAMALAKAVSGAKVSRVLNSHIFRRVDPSPVEGRPPADQTADKVHTDFTPQSAAGTLFATFGENVAKNCGRYGIINVWRPVVDVVYDCPLGVTDARTLEKDYLGTCNAIGPNFVAPFQIGLVGGEEKHKWYYVSRQTSSEALVFKQFDSDASKAQWVLHTGFQDPTAPAEGGFSGRESIEIRIFVFYDIDEEKLAELQAAGTSSA